MKKKIKAILFNPLLLLFLGSLLRLHYFIMNPPFWRDEIWVTQITSMSLDSLFLSTNGLVSTPAFLFLIKLSTLAFGVSEWAFRVPIICISIINLFLFYSLSKRFFNRLFLYFATALFCFSDNLIFYSVQLKQYQFDVFAVLVVLILLEPIFKQKLSLRLILLYGLIGALLCWLSHPIIFVLFAIGLAKLIQIIQFKYKKHLFPFLITGSFWASSFLIQMLFNFKKQTSPELTRFWFEYHSFWPIIPQQVMDIFWIPLNLLRFCAYFIGFRLTSIDLQPTEILNISLTEKLNYIASHGLLFLYIGCIACILFILLILGLCRYFRSHYTFFLICIFSFLTPIVASGFHLFPFQSRLLLFLFPLTTLLITQGLIFLYNRNYQLCIAIYFIVLIQPLSSSIFHLYQPRVIELAKPILALSHSALDEDDEAVLLYNISDYYFNQSAFSQRLNIYKNLSLNKISSLSYKSLLVILSYDQPKQLEAQLTHLNTIGNLTELNTLQKKAAIYRLTPSKSKKTKKKYSRYSDFDE